MNVHKNPACNEVLLSITKGTWSPGTLITAYDMSGRRMFRFLPQAGTSIAAINISSWTSGVYIFMVQGKGNNASIKVIVEKP